MVSAPLGPERDGRRAVLGRIVHEVPERAPQQRPIHRELDGGASCDQHATGGQPRIAASALGDLHENLARVGPREARGDSRRLEPRRGKHVLDQALELVQIRLDIFDPRVRAALARQKLERHADPRQG